MNSKELVKLRNVIRNPDDEFYKDFLKDYYVFTKEGQYLFGCNQPGRRPDRAFYMIPEGYKLGYRQKPFPTGIGKKIYQIAMEYLETVDIIVQDSIQGEEPYKTGVHITTSVDNPHSAYIPWIGGHMMYEHDGKTKFSCFNFIITEVLPAEYAERIRAVWPEYDPEVPLTLYDLTEIGKDIRKVLSIRVDYFGGAYKKPNLTLVWNRGESDGLVSYHGGCTQTRIIKGLSGTGKTTLTVGPQLEQDDALLGKVIYDENNKAKKINIIGLEAASFAKSEGLTPDSPEWAGLMRANETTVIAMNIDCENVTFRTETVGRHSIRVPREDEGTQAGSLLTNEYERSGTKNGRFIFDFSALNPQWNTKEKWLKTEALVFKRFNTMEPMFRVIDPRMAVALDSACESIITSAVSGKKAGSKVRSYAATDFMAREQADQAVLKWNIYDDMDLSLNGNLVFFIMNSGYVGRNDINGTPRTDANGTLLGEKIRVQDSKRILELIDNNLIEEWVKTPIFGYLVPDPMELEETHGMDLYAKRFNFLNHYTAEELLAFARQDIEERTGFLRTLFAGQEKEDELHPIIEYWNNITLPDKKCVEKFYKKYYR